MQGLLFFTSVALWASVLGEAFSITALTRSRLANNVPHHRRRANGGDTATTMMAAATIVGGGRIGCALYVSAQKIYRESNAFTLAKYQSAIRYVRVKLLSCVVVMSSEQNWELALAHESCCRRLSAPVILE